MANITTREAINQAIDEEMERDPNVFLLGEEVAEYNGAYKISKGLLMKYGSRRIIDTPIAELGFTGLGVGAALAGLRPIVEWMTFNFSLLAADQVINNAAKMRHMSGSQLSCPIVFRGPNGPAEYLAAQHSQAFQSLYAHIPGLKVVVPATPNDAKGLMKSAIRDNNPVLVLESELAYNWKGEVQDGDFTIPIGKADIKREGSDVSIIVHGKPLYYAIEAAEILAQRNISVEIIDLRTVRPLDENTIYHSVAKTHRAVVVDESWPVCSVGSHVAYMISSFCFDDLDAPVQLVSSEDVPVPYNHTLELAAQPSAQKIIEAIERIYT